MMMSMQLQCFIFFSLSCTIISSGVGRFNIYCSSGKRIPNETYLWIFRIILQKSEIFLMLDHFYKRSISREKIVWKWGEFFVTINIWSRPAGRRIPECCGRSKLEYCWTVRRASIEIFAVYTSQTLPQMFSPPNYSNSLSLLSVIIVNYEP